MIKNIFIKKKKKKKKKRLYIIIKIRIIRFTVFTINQIRIYNAIYIYFNFYYYLLLNIFVIYKIQFQHNNNIKKLYL